MNDYQLEIDKLIEELNLIEKRIENLLSLRASSDIKESLDSSSSLFNSDSLIVSKDDFERKLDYFKQQFSETELKLNELRENIQKSNYEQELDFDNDVLLEDEMIATELDASEEIIDDMGETLEDRDVIFDKYKFLIEKLTDEIADLRSKRVSLGYVDDGDIRSELYIKLAQLGEYNKNISLYEELLNNINTLEDEYAKGNILEEEFEDRKYSIKNDMENLPEDMKYELNERLNNLDNINKKIDVNAAIEKSSSKVKVRKRNSSSDNVDKTKTVVKVRKKIKEEEDITETKNKESESLREDNKLDSKSVDNNSSFAVSGSLDNGIKYFDDILESSNRVLDSFKVKYDNFKNKSSNEEIAVDEVTEFLNDLFKFYFYLESFDTINVEFENIDLIDKDTKRKFLSLRNEVSNLIRDTYNINIMLNYVNLTINSSYIISRINDTFSDVLLRFSDNNDLFLVSNLKDLGNELDSFNSIINLIANKDKYLDELFALSNSSLANDFKIYCRQLSTRDRFDEELERELLVLHSEITSYKEEIDDVINKFDVIDGKDKENDFAGDDEVVEVVNEPEDNKELVSVKENIDDNEEVLEKPIKVVSKKPWNWIKNNKMKSVLIGAGIAAVAVSAFINLIPLNHAVNSLEEATTIANVANDMVDNSLKWHGSSSSMQVSLHNLNETLASKLSSLTGKVQNFNSSTGIWSFDGIELSNLASDVSNNITLLMSKISSLSKTASAFIAGGISSVGLGMILPNKKNKDNDNTEKNKELRGKISERISSNIGLLKDKMPELKDNLVELTQYDSYGYERGPRLR